MPTDTDIRNYKTLMENGKCSCGNLIDGHCATYDEMKSPETINCKLLKGEVIAYHTPLRADR